MSTVVWSVTKAALLGTFLGIIGLIPVAAAAYAGWLYCPKLLLAVELAAEACFALYYFFIIAKQLDAMPEQHDPPADYNPQQLVASFLRHMARVDDIQGYLSQWFLDAPYDLIRHDNVKELVAFAIFFKTPEQVAQQGLMPQLDALLEQLSAMHNLQLPPGYNPNLKFMSHLWGATPHMYRPLFFYVVMEVIELLCWAILACCGFKRHSVLGCAYYTYGLPDPQQQQQQADKEHQQCKPVPTVSDSVQVVLALASHCLGSIISFPLILPLPYCSPSCHPSFYCTALQTIPTVDDSVDVVLAALARHGLSSAAVLGHSYGSLVAARLVRLAPEVVHTLAVVDPVCFAMHMPNLVKYFLYSPHASGNAVADAFIALLRSEIHCARNFTRNFFWATINLFDEHLPERTLVVLSGTDLLCPTAYVRDWLEGHTAATVLYHATASHGSDSDAATLDSGSESDSDSEDLSGFDAADWGSSSDGEEAQKRSKEGCAGVDAIADADGSKERSSREGDAGWCDVPGCTDAADAAVELELLRDAASSLPGEVKGSGGSLQQQQQQQQRGGRRQGLVRRARSCGADAVMREERQQLKSSYEAPLIGQWLHGTSVGS
ncbi:hypothetical protein OEZ85_004243 [Tetradesmus obliquus]|uniref:AB hydrolase-1 domain-containing protein n=1 Tax=Tetradesmus obliquus TaxID=3088 RepID=A0ABY8UKS9_TETOB|nr:hypothetical protein OEZ85_004243 [Tetradesmus obliquus]